MGAYPQLPDTVLLTHLRIAAELWDDIRDELMAFAEAIKDIDWYDSLVEWVDGIFVKVKEVLPEAA